MESHFAHNNTHSHSNENDFLYHIDVYFPEHLRTIAVNFLKGLTDMSVYKPGHVMNTIMANLDGESHNFTRDDIYGAIHKVLYEAKNDKPLYIFEMGWNKVPGEDGKVQLNKVVVRTSLDADLDISLVFLRTGPDKATLKTAWINKKDDLHKEGLNTSRYVQDPKKKDIKDTPTPKKKVVVKVKRPLDSSDYKRIFDASNS